MNPNFQPSLKRYEIEGVFLHLRIKIFRAVGIELLKNEIISGKLIA
jgi:hypothetical protein